MNKNGVLEEICGYLAPKKDKSTKKIWWSSEHPVATGRQRKCDTILGRISCLAPNSRANTIQNIEDIFHLYFDNDIMGKIVDCTNTRINETIACLQGSDNFNKSSKYTWVKKPRHSWNWYVVSIDALQRNTWSKSSYDWYTILKWQSFCFWWNNVKKPFQISQKLHLFRQPTRKSTAVGQRQIRNC